MMTGKIVQLSLLDQSLICLISVTAISSVCRSGNFAQGGRSALA